MGVHLRERHVGGQGVGETSGMHPKWVEDPTLQERVEGFTGRDFDDSSKHVQRPSIAPACARLLIERKPRNEFDAFGE